VGVRERACSAVSHVLRALAICLGFLVMGCQAMMYGTASDFTRLSLGMTKSQVIQTIGEPNTVRADALTGEEHLTYRRMPQVVGWLPYNYDVTLRDGRVVSFGEFAK
jgi:hypothetical protein